MKKRKISKDFKRLVSGFIATTIITSTLSILPATAEDISEKYPYTMFAASVAEGAITVNAGNFCVNGNIATNGTIVSSGNTNINGTRTEQAAEEMLYIFDKIDSKYFTGSNVEEYTEDYTLEEMNININNHVEVEGDATLTGNININSALKALENVELYGEVKNTNDSLIFSKYGDIIIESQNVNLNGLVYAPFGDVVVTSQNLNLNNVVIIADTITFDCPSVNANYSNSVAEFAGSVSDPLNIPYEEWRYMKDDNQNDFPDFFEDFDNWSKMLDTDYDGLPNSIEESIGSNLKLVDSDGDNLDDYYEVFVTYTDPTKVDTDSNEITDDREDFDKDSLINSEEYNCDTEPWNEDSDEDGLKDGEEYNVYNTNPLKKDTDDDGLEDGDEISLNVLPDNPDTDGDGILDGEEYYTNTISQELDVNDSKVSAITDISVKIDCQGNAENCVTIENTYNIDMLSTNVVGIVGAPVNITSTADFETATITFSYDESLLNGTPEENLAILWYDEENKQYVILDEETVVDTENNTVSYTTTHFSTYLVIDREIWYDCWREEIDYRNLPGTIEVAYDIGFVVDVSGSMSGDYLNRAKTALNTFIDAMYACDNATLVEFASSAKVVKEYGSSKSELKSAVSSLYASGGTSTNSGLSAAIDEMVPHLSKDRKAIIILICDGDVEYDSTTEALIEAAQDEDTPIAIYTVNVCDSDSEKLTSISVQTGGIPYNAVTSEDIASVMATLQHDTISSVDMTDSDSDGLYDVYEVNGIKIQNGQKFFTNSSSADSDNDGISDLDEFGGTPIYKIVKFLQIEYSCVMCNMNSSPVEADIDDDGYMDDIDPEPNNFTIIKDFGSANYINDIEIKSIELNPDALSLTTWPYLGDYIFYETIGKKDIANSAIELMMKDVNECPYTFLVADDEWLNFCLYFNEQVSIYGKVYEELHYFRNKLNRAPATIDEMIELINSTDNVSDKWVMCSPYKGRYHMFGTDGAYNIKFISSNNTDNIYEAVYNKNGVLISEYDNYGQNMGTYNYASSSKEKLNHTKYDVDTYNDWGNTIYDTPPKNNEQDDNVTKEKHPSDKNNVNEIDFDAKEHFTIVCSRIGINYESLVENNYSDKCY